MLVEMLWCHKHPGVFPFLGMSAIKDKSVAAWSEGQPSRKKFTQEVPTIPDGKPGRDFRGAWRMELKGQREEAEDCEPYYVCILIIL